MVEWRWAGRARKRGENVAERYDFAADFARLGIRPGDALLMHSSMKALGTEETPEAFLNALMDYLGEEGTLMLPALTYASVTAEQPLFQIRATEPCVGLLPRVFMHMPGVVRSMHPTHSCCARGRLARELTEGHGLDRTPVGPNSPFRLLADLGGRILMVGDIDDHCTFMHGMEEIAGAPYCLKKEPTRYLLEDAEGNRREAWLYGHDFHQVARQRYGRFGELLTPPDLLRGNICRARCALIDARALRAAAVEKLREDPWFFVDKKEETTDL